MPDITELGFATEQLSTIDQQAAEAANSFSPSIKPGYHNFTFALEEPTDKAPWTVSDKDGVRVYTLIYKLTEAVPEGKTVRFCRASSYKSAAMKNSRLGELLYALGLGTEYNAEPTIANADRLLKQAEGQQAQLRGLVIWRAYDKDSGLTLSTSPQKGYTKSDGTQVPDELPWPKAEDGSLMKHPQFPNGNYAEGRAEVVRVASMQKAKAAVN